MYYFQEIEKERQNNYSFTNYTLEGICIVELIKKLGLIFWMGLHSNIDYKGKLIFNFT